ncbi:hypothetical protein [Neobacillus jeddahensis]|uniref:hypothetical protein n=1 Tax=Neobacillus jeddahensis TaxID=1461580 RepID=UPI0005902103|nr:hypothetical protein [Neobacillus jeddahensis]
MGIITVILGLKEISSEYLATIFKQKNAGALLKKYKSKNLYYQNRYLVQTKLEWLNFTRNMIFKEQELLFLLLIILTIGMNYLFDKTNFLLFYSFIIQFGIKEILIMLPLVMGIHFRKNKQALYNINEGKYPYLLPRIFFTYLLNCLAYFAFVLIIYLLLGMKNDGMINVMISIAFITTLSVLVGYLIKISDGNRIFVILTLLILVNTIDLVIQQTIYSQLKVNVIYIFLTLLIFLIIKVMFIRRPIFK